ncbi:hypothetical protein E1281_18930 [Actinomadura sp. KC345]|uniref:hypothetical protein n=1 Tax=Actinomadura sp. KC345 TaxID=2530371 RepID=UPI0010529CB7|nr:hypothetical protein [Actinomadura sp. KC345]TDC52527.1 hypothetical protein E1281_18930 [Actinomadura sp. KC345]
MSFDLCVWRENHPITGAQALRTYWWLCGSERLGAADESEFTLAHDERVDAFHTELLDAHPPLEGLDTAEAEDSPWSMTPDHMPGSYVIMMMGFSDAPEIAPAVIDLAGRYDLVCYDPQAMRVHNPGEIVDTDGPRLEFCDGGIVNDPRPRDLPDLLGQITDRNWFAVLERRPGWFMQVGIGERAGGLPDGVFGLEYREGDEDRHFRVLLSDPEEVAHAFQGYAEGHDHWKSTLDWQQE